MATVAPRRADPRGRRRGLLAIPLAVTVLAGALTAGAASATTLPPRGSAFDPLGSSSVAAPHVDRFSLAGTDSIFTVASVKTDSLVSVGLLNSTYELILYDAKSNTSANLGPIPGGTGIAPSSSVAAGGAFFLAIVNFTTGANFYEKVTLAGKVSRVTLPFGGAAEWNFVFGNSSVLFATETGGLEELDASTLHPVANFSSALPAGLSINDMASVGPVVYLAGTIANASGQESGWFGELDTSTGTITPLLPLHFVPTPASEGFFSLGLLGGEVYFGGALRTSIVSGANFTLRTDLGLLYRYSPTAKTATNLSSLLPKAERNESVWAIEPWGRSLALNVGGYDLNSSVPLYWEGSNLLKLSVSGSRLSSEDALLPPGFIAQFFEITSESGGYLFLGGINSASGTAEIVAIHL